MPKRAARTTNDKGSRATRSGFQGGLVALLIMVINLFLDPDLTTEQAGVIAVVALPVFSYLQNLLEEQGAVPTMLKGTPPAPPTDDLDDRKFEALAAALGNQHDAIERLENALLDLRADRRPVEPEDPVPWPPGGLG